MSCRVAYLGQGISEITSILMQLRHGRCDDGDAAVD